MNKNDLKERLKLLAIKSARLCTKLSLNLINKVYIGQLIRCSSSSAANYRAACRGKSKADFINKLRIVEEELDESMFFYEMLAEFNSENKNDLRELYKEADELLSIIVASINTAISNSEKEKENLSKKSEIVNLKSKISDQH
ncbi:MAG: four helix bundle protein [Chitinophagaceae bacterium]